MFLEGKCSSFTTTIDFVINGFAIFLGNIQISLVEFPFAIHNTWKNLILVTFGFNVDGTTCSMEGSLCSSVLFMPDCLTVSKTTSYVIMAEN